MKPVFWLKAVVILFLLLAFVPVVVLLLTGSEAAASTGNALIFVVWLVSVVREVVRHRASR